MDRQTEEEKTPPKVHSEKCPVCNGFGTLKYGEKTCQGCDGKGWVIVPNEILTMKQDFEKGGGYGRNSST